jgi:deoxyribodipyrimidine photo-lyase
VVAWNRGVEPAERERDRRVAAALQGDGVKVLVDWDQLLVPPETIFTGAGDPYRVYGPFLRNWCGQVERRATAGELDPRPAPRELLDLDPASLPRPELWAAPPLLEMLSSPTQLAAIAAASGDPGARGVRPGEAGGAPSADACANADLWTIRAFNGADLCPCRPGEAAAQAQLEAFADGPALARYDEGRNLPGEAGTSALSAALRFGTLTAEESADLTEWSPVPAERTTVSPGGTVSVTPAAGTRGFARLRAEANP